MHDLNFKHDIFRKLAIFMENSCTFYVCLFFRSPQIVHCEFGTIFHLLCKFLCNFIHQTEFWGFSKETNLNFPLFLCSYDEFSNFVIHQTCGRVSRIWIVFVDISHFVWLLKFQRAGKVFHFFFHSFSALFSSLFSQKFSTTNAKKGDEKTLELNYSVRSKKVGAHRHFTYVF